MRTLNIAQWAEEKGNFMLEHFLQLVPEDWYQMSTNYYVPWRQRDRETRINPIENRRVREGPANVADLRFVEEHLEEWFAVIGITERFEESMMLFAFALAGKSIPKNMLAKKINSKSTQLIFPFKVKSLKKMVSGSLSSITSRSSFIRS